MAIWWPKATRLLEFSRSCRKRYAGNPAFLWRTDRRIGYSSSWIQIHKYTSIYNSKCTHCIGSTSGLSLKANAIIRPQPTYSLHAADVTTDKMWKLSSKKVSCPVCLNCHFRGESGLFKVKWWSACRWVGSGIWNMRLQYNFSSEFAKQMGKSSISPLAPWSIKNLQVVHTSLNIHVFPCLVQL